MAPIKLEENIKEKLEKRTLKPSVSAWGKLSERLENQEEKRNNKAFWWLGIAASVIGVLFIGTQFLKNEPFEKVVLEVIVTPEIIKEEEKQKIANEEVNLVEKRSEEINLKEAKSNKIKKKSEAIKLNLAKEVFTIAEEKNSSQLKKERIELVKIVSKNGAIEEQKIQEVIAQINDLKDANNQVTEQEIDALLASAQKEIKLKRLYNESTKKVDALALLQDVEEELDQSFRTKVFKALKESFITVKTAVAQRND